jgi:glycosyltransferase involved in cell wall biosynthesis
MPCWQRPQRTRRAIECILSQSISNWEAIVVGDGCPDFQALIDSGYMPGAKARAEAGNNSLIALNLASHFGGYGYECRRVAIELATGTYVVFVDNDDVIAPDHCEHYLSGIEATSLDMAYFDSFVLPHRSARHSELEYGKIGHSELIVRTSFLKQQPAASPEYGHDWELVRAIVDSGAKCAKCTTGHTTYNVMSLGNFRETGID